MTGRPSGRCAAQDLLADARPYVYGATHDPDQPWRRETGQTILEAIDAALASPCCVSADQAQVTKGLGLAAELREALDDPQRHVWGGYPWEHLGDAERDVRVLLRALALLGSQNEQED